MGSTLWDWRTGELRRLPTIAGTMSFSRDGRFLGQVGHHHSAVLSVEFSPDGRFIASGENGLLRVWRIAKPKLATSIRHEATTRAALSPDGQWVVATGHGHQSSTTRSTRVHAVRTVGASEMQIRFHDTSTDAATPPAIPYVGWPFVSRFNGTGEQLLTAGGGGLAQVWHWKQARLACPMLPHADAVPAACFVPGKPWVITGLEVTPDGRTLVVSGWFDRDFELVDLTAAFPESDLDLEGTRLLSEIDAGAVVHPGGGLAQLARPEWMEKWREFQQRHPDYPGHRLGL